MLLFNLLLILVTLTGISSESVEKKSNSGLLTVHECLVKLKQMCNQGEKVYRMKENVLFKGIFNTVENIRIPIPKIPFFDPEKILQGVSKSLKGLQNFGNDINKKSSPVEPKTAIKTTTLKPKTTPKGNFLTQILSSITKTDKSSKEFKVEEEKKDIEGFHISDVIEFAQNMCLCLDTVDSILQKSIFKFLHIAEFPTFFIDFSQKINIPKAFSNWFALFGKLTNSDIKTKIPNDLKNIKDKLNTKDPLNDSVLKKGKKPSITSEDKPKSKNPLSDLVDSLFKTKGKNVNKDKDEPKNSGDKPELKPKKPPVKAEISNDPDEDADNKPDENAD